MCRLRRTQSSFRCTIPATALRRRTLFPRKHIGHDHADIRGDASTSAEIVGHARRGERLTVVGDFGDWLHIKLNDGTTTGWVSSQLVVREGAAARPRHRGCPPDSNYSF